VSDFNSIPNAVPPQSLSCEQCEALLADALDGVLTGADQAAFDRHIHECAACAAMMSDAQRGAAWLEILRSPRPEPSAELLDRILAQTSGHAASSSSTSNQTPKPILVPSPSVVPAPISHTNVIPFRSRIASSLTHILHEPRLAMTAAMAFFSIALTLSMTGIQLKDIRLSQLSPANLERTFFSANAAVIRYYDNLSVVAELQSRVRGLQLNSTSDTDTTIPQQPITAPVEPSVHQQDQHDQQSAPKQPNPGAGTSHREVPAPDSTQTRTRFASPAKREPAGTSLLTELSPAQISPAPQGFSQHKDQA
jgi:Putative zinc-finger